MLTTSRIIDELTAFNQTQGTAFSIQDLRKFNFYKDNYGLETEDALDYIQTCHACNSQLETFAGEYCCFACFNNVEELDEPCFRGDDCLICHRPLIMPAGAILVDETECEHTSYEDLQIAMFGYVGIVTKQELPDSTVAKFEDWWFVIKPIANDPCKFNVSMYSLLPTLYLEREFDQFLYYIKETIRFP